MLLAWQAHCLASSPLTRPPSRSTHSRIDNLRLHAQSLAVLADLGVEKDLAFSRREGDLGEFVKSEGGEIVSDFELEAELGLCHA